MGGINAMDQYLDFFHYETVGASTGISEYLSSKRRGGTFWRL